MVRQAIDQADCESCDDGEFRVTDKSLMEEQDGVSYSVRCTCGETGTIEVTEAGTDSSDGINHANASWNEAEA